MRPEGGLGAGSRGRLRGASQLPARGQVEINGRTNVIPPGLDKAKHSPPGKLSSPLGGWRSLSSDTRGGDLILATDAETVCASLLAVCARLLLDSESGSDRYEALLFALLVWFHQEQPRRNRQAPLPFTSA